MPKTIIWSPLAERDFLSILEYLHENWEMNVVQAFIDIAFNSVSLISVNPKLFPLINKSRKIRKCVLTRHNSLFYRDGKESIEILRIFDNRQDPHKLIFI